MYPLGGQKGVGNTQIFLWFIYNKRQKKSTTKIILGKLKRMIRPNLQCIQSHWWCFLPIGNSCNWPCKIPLYRQCSNIDSMMFLALKSCNWHSLSTDREFNWSWLRTISPVSAQWCESNKLLMWDGSGIEQRLYRFSQ